MTDDVLTLIDGRVGRIRLNRPKALHALTEDMCTAMIQALVTWRADPTIEAVLIDHAASPDGDPKLSRGFCAGGDVRAVAESGRRDGVAARRFFYIEYQLNHLLFTYAKPVVAVMDGIVMGGGVGIALPARHRIATERTILAMPEATIGLFPDVGGGWYLSRLPGRIGQYLALSAARLDGAEVHALGMATAYVPSERIEEVKAALIADPSAIAATLEAATAPPPRAAILDRRAEIDRLFISDRLEDIFLALETDGGEWAAATLAGLRAKSPQACKVALELLARSTGLTDFADEMRMEYGVAAHVCQRHDFLEGVRALLIDKDNAPRWDPATAEGVTDHLIDTIFAPLPEDERWEAVRL